MGSGEAEACWEGLVRRKGLVRRRGLLTGALPRGVGH